MNQNRASNPTPVSILQLKQVGLSPVARAAGAAARTARPAARSGTVPAAPGGGAGAPCAAAGSAPRGRAAGPARGRRRPGRRGGPPGRRGGPPGTETSGAPRPRPGPAPAVSPAASGTALGSCGKKQKPCSFCRQFRSITSLATKWISCSVTSVLILNNLLHLLESFLLPFHLRPSE